MRQGPGGTRRRCGPRICRSQQPCQASCALGRGTIARTARRTWRKARRSETGRWAPWTRIMLGCRCRCREPPVLVIQSPLLPAFPASTRCGGHGPTPSFPVLSPVVFSTFFISPRRRRIGSLDRLTAP
ncbi:hypothetical protein CALCODRAFT_127216 [Calocera cornea HHB12733]|uniref:Uncharacterized protein n=1 Tax=Calocera cornea HHB12733 TaxID=1353952 RepID=A0A165I8I8_9BASI|nr:hypothetical protein CALCODRAFT_127216 [Calocera cornea HHB12733]